MGRKAYTEAEQIANFHSYCKVNEKTEDNCLEWTACLFSNGYGQFTWKGITVRAHRLAYELHHGREIAEGMMILHDCDNRKCCKIDHLREGTHQDNMADRNIKDRQAKGESAGNSKLTPIQVAEIREKIKNCSQTELATEYNVSNATISHIINNKTWKP